jgi:hypothetical protein
LQFDRIIISFDSIKISMGFGELMTKYFTKLKRRVPFLLVAMLAGISFVTACNGSRVDVPINQDVITPSISINLGNEWAGNLINSEIFRRVE